MSSQTPGSLTLLQITDTHLFADPAGALLGVRTDDSLRAVLAAVRANPLSANAILASGDLVHDHSPAGYARLRQHFAAFDLPVLMLPGNHDEAGLLRRHACAGLLQAPREHVLGDWQIVLLDTTVPGSDAGHLCAGELQALDDCLARGQSPHALVCLHHPPLAVGSRWLDTMAIANAGAFFEITDRHPRLRAIVWGHIHQKYDGVRNGVRLLATPSTCFQFLPHSRDFALDERPPGYRWIRLLPDGSIETDVVRLREYHVTLDHAAGGY